MANSVSPRDRRWSGLLLYLAIDEAARIHELATAPVRRAIGTTSPIFLFDWVIPAIAVLVLVGAALIPFLFRLPARTRFGFVWAATLSVAGAVGMELVAGAYQGRHFVQQDPIYILIFTIEESMRWRA